MKSIKWSLMMMMALLFAIAPAQSWAKKKITLRYKLEKGAVYIFNSKVDQNMQMKVMSNTVNTHTAVAIEQASKVSAATADQFTMTNTIEKMVMDVSSMGINMHIDSSDPSTYAAGREKMVGETMDKVIGKPFDLSLNQYGKITSTDLGELSKSLASLGDKNDQTNFTIFPENKIEIGESWVSDLNAGKGLLVHNKYTLVKASGNTAELSVDGTISSDGANEKITNVSGIQTGTILIDLKTGMTIKATLNQEIKMEVSQSGMTIPAHITSIINLNVKKK
ncbi:MAG: hypothetical protein JXR71_00520 [Bacteroidales bacterium]|nr:hypothetical protein [Bacteroidales bacterium]